MRRSWKTLLVVWGVIWVCSVSWSVSTRLPVPSLQPFLNLAAPSPHQLPGAPQPSSPRFVQSLLELETSTDPVQDERRMSKKWLVVVVVTSAIPVVVAVAVAVAIFLRRQCRRDPERRSSSRKSGSMLVWTNQLSGLHQAAELFSGSENNLRSSSAKLDSTTQGLNLPWPSASTRSAAGHAPCALRYALLQAATSNFSGANLLGEGSFGLVYKAWMDCNGGEVAVKRLCGTGSKHGQEEFQREVDLMCQIRHPNLVALLGYSNDGPEPLVVYELMQNGSLHDYLHGPSRGTALTWHRRLKIALEAARGLEHLHERCKPPIIHRDFKASNILLDANFNAKVSDFGLAVALEEGGLLKEDVQVQGTFGYIAPEYIMSGILTEKSDVYGFGVVLLELLTGRLPIDVVLPLGSQSLVTWVTPLLQNPTKLMEILDPNLQDSVNKKHLQQVAAVAVLCVQAEPSYRPLIRDVVRSLLLLVPHELGGAWRDPDAHRGMGTCNTQKLGGPWARDAPRLFLPTGTFQNLDIPAILHTPGSERDAPRLFSPAGTFQNLDTPAIIHAHGSEMGAASMEHAPTPKSPLADESWDRITIASLETPTR